MNLEKNLKIGQTRNETREKRKSQICKVFKIKIQENSLSRSQAEFLKMFFVEAKWIYNDILNFSKESNIYTYNYKVKKVLKLDKNKNVIEQDLKYLHSQIKQTLIQNIITSIKSLSSKKKLGFKVGRLKFKSQLNSLDLKQYGISYKIIGKNRVKIGGIKKPFKVNGLNQINLNETEFANAKFLHTSSGFYLAITTYMNKDQIKDNDNKDKINQTIGIDFGCSTSFTLSNGEKINISIGESERLKTLQRKLARQKKGSNNRYKTILKIKKEYEQISNKKNDIANKFVSKLNKYKTIIIQDEQLNNWMINHGRKVQHSILGRVKSRFIKLDNVKVLNKYVPTTKMCVNCGKIHEMPLSQRTFKCDCGLEEDRDLHAANNMVWFYKNNIGVGRTEIKPVELRNLVSKALKQEDVMSLA